MKTPSISTLSFILLLITISFSSPASADGHDDFIQCLSQQFRNYSSISNDVYTPLNSSFTSILQFSIRNLRYATNSTPKPQVIVTPELESQVPPLILCAKKTGLEIRTRSGGHDFEGLSYVSHVPFVIIDLIRLSETTVDVEEKTAWIGAGATTGSVFYRIAEKSPVLGFPGALVPFVGVGGHFSGGGYGAMMRKYGLAGDNVIDARIVDVNGRILDRKSMGEDLFWAIRGGGAASFGVVVAWKVQLVDIPETVTVFSVVRTLEQNLTQLIHRWQYVAPTADKDLFIGVTMYRANTTIQATIFSLFLGGVDRLLPLMQETFPELGIVREDCVEMSWAQSALFIAQLPSQSIEALLNRSEPNVRYLKVKSDYVQTPVPEMGFQGIVRMLYEPEASGTLIYMVPYGGRMDEISESATPFPHRAGNLYKLASLVYWQEADSQNSDRYISWSRRYYSFMEPFVSRNPRAAYLNYRDLDIGVNNPNGKTSYAQASVWGRKYFNKNFDRLVRVKSVVDPGNFFKNEQSIPPLSSKWIKKGH